jgi:hypothetical protein
MFFNIVIWENMIEVIKESRPGVDLSHMAMATPPALREQ